MDHDLRAHGQLASLRGSASRLSVPNLAAFEGAAPQLMGDKDWQANYQKIGALVESGYREIFTLVG